MTATRLLAVLALSALAACSRSPAQAPASKPPPATTAPAAQAQDVHRFKIGALDAAALKDGDIDVANDGKTFGVGRSPSEVAAVLAAAGLPTDTLRLSIQPLLVKAPDHVLLFDTGAGDASFARAGRLPTSLREAGIEPAQITDIFISHAHPDHVGGLLTRDGALAFPNATIHISAREWDSMRGDPAAARLVAAVASKVATFQPGATILPGLVTAVAAQGHTPGHSAYEIGSGKEQLLFIGDIAHHAVVSLARPDWRCEFDGDDKAARLTRRAILERAADENLRVYAGHFPFPGLGHVRPSGTGFTWVPET